MFTFGQIPTDQGDERFELTISDDRRALTLMFSDLLATVGSSRSPSAMSTRVFSLVLPLEGEEERVEIELVAQGSIVVLEGATATLVCSVNGQTTVADFPSGSDDSFVQKLTFVADAPSEARLCVFLLLGRDSANADAEAHLNVSSIDAEILPRIE